MPIDLSTCVNPYGPPPAVREALRNATAGPGRPIGPDDAAERLRALYARRLEVGAAELVAARSATELIRALSRQVRHDRVAIALPACQDHLTAFPGRGLPGGPVPTIERLDAALAAAQLVIVANPHDPTGVALPAGELIAAARRHPHATLIVDESYVEFVADPITSSVVGGDADNLVVLRSPSQFWGIAEPRVAIAWCRDRERLDGLLGPRETSPIDGRDVLVAEAAMGSVEWAAQARRALHRDAAWLAVALRWLPGTLVERDVGVHVRCLVSEQAGEIAARFAEQGVTVRVVGRAHGAGVPMLRILAPQRHQRPAVIDAVRAVLGTGPGATSTHAVLAAA